MKMKIFTVPVAVTLLLVCMSLPANASLIKYNFFSFLSSGYGNAFASGSLTYDTWQETFVDGIITTTPSRDRWGNLSYPGRLYNQVNLVNDPNDTPYGSFIRLSIWEDGAIGALNEHAMFINFAPYSGSLDRLEVFGGAEGPCGYTLTVETCLIRNDRILRLSAGRAIASEIIQISEPSTLALWLISCIIFSLSIIRDQLKLLVLR